MQIKLTVADCRHREGKFYQAVLMLGFIIGAFLVAVGIINTGIKAGASSFEIISNFTLSFIGIGLVFGLVALLVWVRIITEPLDHAYGFVEAAKRKIEEAYGLKEIELDRKSFWSASRKPVVCYAAFANNPDTYEKMVLEVLVGNQANEAVIDVQLSCAPKQSVVAGRMTPMVLQN